MSFTNLIILILFLAGPTIGKVVSDMLKEREEQKKSAQRKLKATFGQPMVDESNKNVKGANRRAELAAKRKAEAEKWREMQEQRNHMRNPQSPLTTYDTNQQKPAIRAELTSDSRKPPQGRIAAIQEALIQAGYIQQQQLRPQQQRQRRQQQAAAPPPPPVQASSSPSTRRAKHVSQHSNRHFSTDPQQSSNLKISSLKQSAPRQSKIISKIKTAPESTMPIARVTPDRLFFGSAGIPLNRTTLRQAIILKELLDKPIALREDPSYYL